MYRPSQWCCSQVPTVGPPAALHPDLQLSHLGLFMASWRLPEPLHSIALLQVTLLITQFHNNFLEIIASWPLLFYSQWEL